MKTSEKYNKSMSIVFISTCVIFLASLIILECDYSNIISYRLHELCTLSINIGLFIVPIESVIGFVFWMRYRRDKVKVTIVNSVLNLISVVILLICICFYVYKINSFVTIGCSKDFKKYTVNNGYYVKLEDKMFEISEDQYNSFEDDKWYNFQYRYNKLISDKYKMTTFEREPSQ